MKTKLLDRTLELARSTKEPVTNICSAAGVTTRWYYMLMDGKIHDPGVRRIQRLHDYLLARAPAEQSDEQPADHQPSEATAA